MTKKHLCRPVLTGAVHFYNRYGKFQSQKGIELFLIDRRMTVGLKFHVCSEADSVQASLGKKR